MVDSLFIKRSAISIFLLASITACGGGGAGKSTQGDTAPAVDTIAPILELSGYESIEVVVDTNYFDPGATASDNLDGDITAQIVVSSSVNTAIPGEYSVSYNVTDAASNGAAEVFRNVTVVTPQAVKSQYGPTGFVKIESGENGFPDILDNGDRFSRDHDIAGDVDGDGIADLVIGARSDDDGGTDTGAVYILFMNANGSVKDYQKISMLEGGFTDTLLEGNFFGYGVAGIGDYDGDTIPDIAVTASTPPNQALYIIHLNADGTVKSLVKNDGIPGQGLSAAGDLDGDSRIDLIAADPGAARGGAIHILFLDSNSMVIPASTVIISSTQGGFGEGISAGDDFGGRESAVLGDIDGDGTLEVAVGAFQSDGGIGAIWILSLDTTTFNVVDKVKISSGQSGFDEIIPGDENPNGTLGGQFGHAMTAIGDLNGDGVVDLFTGANQYEEGNAYILYLNADKTVKTYTRINGTEGGFNLGLDPEERFSRSIASAGDPTSSGEMTINVGGGAGAGSAGTLFQLKFESCDFVFQGANTFWSGGSSLFSNWSHENQLVTGPITFEECTVKAFETDANNLTFSGVDGRCIVQDETAVLSDSTEGSTAYVRQCL